MIKYIYSISVAILLLLQSCDSYLESDVYNQVDSEVSFNTVSDIKAARNGLYYHLGTYRFCGNYVLSIGDFASDISVADAGTGHFVSINDYAIVEEGDEILKIWTRGYKIVNISTQLINAVKEMLSLDDKTESEVDELQLYMAEAYGLRALTYFYMVNIFGLPYGTDTNANGGLVLMDSVAVLPEEDVSRSSVTDTYSLILKDIENSLSSFDKVSSSSTQSGFYFNEAGVNALNARVLLYMGNDEGAITAASKALALKGVKELNEEAYIEMWNSLTLSDEDIFTIVKSEDDNLSSNSLNTLYGSYNGSIYTEFINDFEDTDYRLKLIDDEFHPKKFDGIESSAATSNIRLFRVSEMELIIAESSVNLGLLDNAKTALLYTAKRNTAISSVNDLPATKDLLLKFIAKERKREFFQEGQRWYDARRTGELISVSNGKNTNFDVSKFVYPIPADEINSGYNCEQNENWYDYLPE